MSDYAARLERTRLFALDLIERRWRWIIVATWLVMAAWFIFAGWRQIRGFGLGDTDDNMRMSQVRALLAGQDWFDLRQYKMNPPFGANIHWSRLVDLPLAGIILALRPFIGGRDAEQVAVAVAPLLPLLPTMIAIALTVRRMIARPAWPLAIVALFFAGATIGMFLPLRIDHHGWQLALLAIGVSGMTDPRRARGGATTGLAGALSLTIGLEMIIYIALSGVAAVLSWVDDRDERRRLAAFAVSIGGGCALGFAGFASYANRLAVCDALSPVWLSDALLASALLLGLAMLRIERWPLRLLLALVAGAIVAAFHALMWPHCLSRLEGVSPEVSQLWLSHVREARPVWSNGWKVSSLILALPIAGIFGYAILGWTLRHDRPRLRALLSIAAPAVAATALLAWQTRTGPAAQMLGVTGATVWIWIVARKMFASTSSIVRVLGTTAVALIGFGALVPTLISFVPGTPLTKTEQAINRANNLCPTMWAMKPVAQQPAGIVFTFVDLAPRLITVTPHKSIAGPYHRNGDAIADVMHAFRGTADQAHAIMLAHHADYLLTCPMMSQTTIFMSEAPKGFYGQLSRGQVPAWLQPIPLPKDNPLRMWKIVG